MTLQIVQDEAADEVLSTNAFALLCGMLLNQQAPVDVAFAGPAKILDRFGTLDPKAISEAPPEEFAELCALEPAVHPYPESMSVLIQAMARFIVVNYEGDTAAVWQTAGSGEHLLSRLTLLPGMGRRKAQMFVALLARQIGVRPLGWERAAGPYAEAGGFRSVADIHDQESLNKVLNAKSGRRKSERKAGDGRQADSSSAHTTESKGIDVNTADETVEMTDEGTDNDNEETREARKAARRAARKAQRQQAKQGGDSSGLDAGDGGVAGAFGDADADEGSAVDASGDKLTPEQRAQRQAKKAAKRAARRAAAGKEPEPEGERQGRRGGGRKGGLGRGGGRNRVQDAAPQPIESGDAATSTDDPTQPTTDEV